MDVNQIAFSPMMSKSQAVEELKGETEAKWDHLPEELEIEIFLKLDFESLNISQLVCKSWNAKISPILKKLEQKLETLLIDTEPRFSTSSSSWPLPPVFEAVSHDTIVVRMKMTYDVSIVRIMRDNMQMWDLSVQGRIIQYDLSKNLLLVTIKSLDHTKRIEVYDIVSRAKLLTRELGELFGTIFFSGSYILIHHMSTLSTSTGEIINVIDPFSSFKCQINQGNYKCVANFSYPYLILYSNETREMDVRKIDVKSNTIFTIQSLDYEKMKVKLERYNNFILEDVVYKKQHIFALLRCRSTDQDQRSGLLLVFNSEGFLVNQISLRGHVLSWSHTFGGYFAVTMALGHKNSVNLFNTNILINKFDLASPLKTLYFEDKVRQLNYGSSHGNKNCDVTTFQHNTIRRVVTSGSSIIQDKYEFLAQ